MQLREDKVATWEATAKANPRVKAVRDAYVRWCSNRGAAFRASFPLARYLLLHTLRHLLIRQIALECGYSSASVRERIYVGNRHRPHAGVLLSTAASALALILRPVRVRHGAVRLGEAGGHEPACEGAAAFR